MRVTAVMERQISHLVRLVDDLLEVSRITRGVIDVRREPLDLAFIVRSAIDTSRPALEAARHELTVDIPAEPITVSGDAVRLTQVFANLLTNAAKYTNPGGQSGSRCGGTASAPSSPFATTASAFRAAQLGSVFDMFTQVDRSNRRAQGGLGIGLTLVRSLVAMHGGRVEARSAGAGAGSEFLVELPVLTGRRIEGPHDRTPPKAVPAAPDSGRRRQPRCRRDAGHAALQPSARRSRSCTAAARRSTVLETFDPDTVLLDIGMPEMDGYEVSRRIRATPDRQDVLLIALTGWGQEHDYRRSRAAGFDHHLVKPPDIDKLRDLVTAGREESPASF